MRRLLAQAAGEPGDLHGIDLDTITEPVEAEMLVASSTRPVVVGCLSREANGFFDGTASERRDILLRAAGAGAAYVKAEPADIPFLAGKVGGATLIVVLVDPVGTPDNLFRVVDNLASLPADWVGFTTTARKMLDSVRVLEAVGACPKPCFGEAVGDGGIVTRVLGRAYGSRITRAYPETGFDAAPSRPTARDLAELYRIGELTKDTPVYGLLGNPVAQSRTFRLHNRAFAKLDLDAVYIPFQSASAEEFLATMPEAINLRGLSVTMPHKQAALKWAECAGEFAQRIGAANILTLTEKGWLASNTDCSGAFESIKATTSAYDINLTGRHALVLGAGGTTRAAGLALTLLGCRVTVSARNQDKAWDIAGQMGWEVEEWNEAPHGNWDFVANATPVGMYPDLEATPFPAEFWREGMIAFDAVHNPQETRFLRDAAAAGCLTIDGVDMYLRHVADQFRAWTGEDMPKPGLSERVFS
jgi:3-dehydroquinate dehydratase/shikimate dehydrogenase